MSRHSPPARTRVAEGGDRALGEVLVAELSRHRLGPATSDAGAVAVRAGASATAFHGAGTLDRRTVVEIGSVSKTFTGVLLADLAQAGVVALEDPLGRFLSGVAP